MSKSFREVRDCVHHYNNETSNVPELYAQMYIDGVQADYQARYAEWEVIRDEAIAGGFTPPDDPVQPVVETVSEVIARAEAELEHVTYQKAKAKPGSATVLAGYDYVPDIAEDKEFVHITAVVVVLEISTKYLNSYEVKILQRNSGAEIVSIVELGNPEHNFTDPSTFSVAVADGFVRLSVPTTGSGEELLIQHDITYSR